MWDQLYFMISEYLETHVQHAIGLVQAEEAAELEADLVTLQEVDKTTWSGDEQVTAALQLPHLLSNIGTSINDTWLLGEFHTNMNY